MELDTGFAGRRLGGPFSWKEEMTEQTLREIAGPLFFAMLSLYDMDAERTSVGLIRQALASGGVTDKTAKRVLQSIVDASELAAEPA
jgi:hypothetical protein